ncbi:nucleotide exchange factor GrpE [Ralstonia mannitolilytica]|jgi:molecular chaperone GrpE|uniref:Protein GrpE n=1 Tax=Ralstonia mannitolilytica TaxID=105219 RepID=A0AAD2EF33_9RALS|nr:nucleotide exchange factor GrpE [Ralstonia mannitolilytica]MBY4718312.1 nucleotide exchange factor GrpE [Ralstonia mannitolilytica]CAJ0681428.1 Protein GrpE [Ralstonia mannitolilytica]CAJ0693462.1 Protein GrpE [Ralstonia mannitolilytica]CAJ0712119.1 Protein GrpE [Ralstonia mannitolilytica]CAJ0849700.1 Protein GrpE [Ralstonia mannitolilytica]
MKHTSETPSQPDTQAQPTDPASQAANAYSSQAERASADAQAVAGDEAAVAEAVADVDVAELRRQLEAAEEKARQNYENWARATAEGENIRRRAQEDVAKAHKFAIEGFAEYLLPVMDSLQAALADTSGDAAKLREGVELTLKQLYAAFEKGRVTELNPVGEKFDPHRHQAISMVPAEQEPNTVVTVLQRGYTLADRVLRPALVTVAAPK